MAPPYRWLDHGNFAGGMVQDVPRHMLPDGAVWDALDCFVGEEGTLHKRGATKTALSSATVASGSLVCVCQSNDEFPIVKGFIVDESAGAGANILVFTFTPASGTFAVTSNTSGQAVSANGCGRPFQHGDFAVFPVRAPATIGAGTAYRPFGYMGGSTNSSRTSTTNLTVTAGSKTITGLAAGDTAAMAAGDVLSLSKNAANDKYHGRVVSVNVGAGTMNVTPVPTQSFTTGTGTWLSFSVLYFVDWIGAGTTSFRGAQGGASWQNRLVLVGVSAELASAVIAHYPNRIIWSLLPTETSSVNTDADGNMWSMNYGFPANNYADAPWMTQILGCEPVSDGELLITGRPMCSRLVGTLNTNTSTSGGLTYELRPLNQKIPCIDDRATVRTPQGVMMMGPDGIYLYREGNLINTMVGRIQNYYLDNYANAVVYGAGVLPNNHYYLSTEVGTLLCNMDGFRWTRLLAPNTQITNCFTDPADATRVFAGMYKVGSSSTTTKLLRADYLVNPGSAATTDVFGTGPLMTVKTKTYIDGDASRLKQFRHIEGTVRMPGSTGTVTVTSQPGLDGEETGATLGTYSVATSAQSKRFDGTTLSRAMGLQFAQTGNPDECELIDIDLAVRPARLGRIA